MAFEDELGSDISQSGSEDYTLGATGIVTKTISLWTRNIVRYLAIVGFIAAACVITSYAILVLMFDTVGTLGADPLAFVVNLFFFTAEPTLLIVSLGFAIFAFVLNAILYGAAIKFTLDEYGGTGGDVGASFSHSISRVLNFIIVQLVLTFVAAIAIIPASAYTFQAMEAIGPIEFIDPLNPVFPSEAMEMLMVAMVLFVVGGIFIIYFNTRFAPTLAIVIDTDLSAIDSFKKSWELTSGNFFHVFGSFILMNIVVFIFSIIVSGVAYFTGVPTYDQLVIGSVVTAFLFSALTYIFQSVLYRDLSSRNQGSSVSSSLDNLRVI
ncbi:hypothetical protein EU528_08575 [Candidatus Thorarchaeota archaeon]|nr:MAG: hypothetical protein EU528_08575 [Candidatus Thorarchaeota archaeon]